MTVADAIVYVLATAGCGMRTERIAQEINLRGLHDEQGGLLQGRRAYPAADVRDENRIKERIINY